MSSEQTQTRPGCIALIGYRGVGKSTVGILLARAIGGVCVDTDDLIVRDAGMAIADIFASEGEVGFRKRERDAIAAVTSAPPDVISVGGGAILDDQNVARLRSVATIVWLTAPMDSLWNRMSTDIQGQNVRPALTDKPGPQEVEQLLAARAPSYKKAADLTIDTQNVAPKEVVRRIVDYIRRGA